MRVRPQLNAHLAVYAGVVGQQLGRERLNKLDEFRQRLRFDHETRDIARRNPDARVRVPFRIHVMAGSHALNVRDTHKITSRGVSIARN